MIGHRQQNERLQGKIPKPEKISSCFILVKFTQHEIESVKIRDCFRGLIFLESLDV